MTENISQKLGTADNHGQKVKDNLVDAKSKDNILAILQCDGNSKVGISTSYYYLLQHSSSYLHWRTLTLACQKIVNFWKVLSSDKGEILFSIWGGRPPKQTYCKSAVCLHFSGYKNSLAAYYSSTTWLLNLLKIKWWPWWWTTNWRDHQGWSILLQCQLDTKICRACKL